MQETAEIEAEERAAMKQGLGLEQGGDARLQDDYFHIEGFRREGKDDFHREGPDDFHREERAKTTFAGRARTTFAGRARTTTTENWNWQSYRVRVILSHPVNQRRSPLRTTQIWTHLALVEGHDIKIM